VTTAEFEVRQMAAMPGRILVLDAALVYDIGVLIDTAAVLLTSLSWLTLALNFSSNSALHELCLKL
jgi:hypothetical protein